MIQEKEGQFYKECGVVMLKTTNESNLYLTLCRIPLHYGSDYFHEKNTLVKIDRKVTNFIQLQPQHLYITSDDEIKDGDWMINTNGDTILKYDSKNEGDNTWREYWRKIIATTDSSIYKKECDKCEGYGHIKCFDPCATCKVTGRIDVLPQPSDKFIQAYIEAYNKGEKIEKVLVEYDRYFEGSSLGGAIIEYGYNLKLKDNIIIEQSEINYKEELEKCKKSVWYFMTKYATINGKPFTTHMSEEEFNKSLTL